EILPNLCSGQLHVVIASRSLRRKLMTHLIAGLALDGPVRVLDGGNCFNGRGLARHLRRESRSFYLPLKRVQISRAFTCYQMTDLLQATPPLPAPTMVLDLLTTFYDESVPITERSRLLDEALSRIQTLSQQAMLVISAPLPTAGDELLPRLEASVDRVWRFEAESASVQPRLF
ncbi:MAG: hypothetical protein U9Q82_10365, partial [Chloroflexota bacterium]|nr:hypothetical protein [Chloroflexota bacterium]